MTEQELEEALRDQDNDVNARNKLAAYTASIEKWKAEKLIEEQNKSRADAFGWGTGLGVGVAVGLATVAPVGLLIGAIAVPLVQVLAEGTVEFVKARKDRAK